MNVHGSGLSKYWHDDMEEHLEAKAYAFATGQPLSVVLPLPGIGKNLLRTLKSRQDNHVVSSKGDDYHGGKD